MEALSLAGVALLSAAVGAAVAAALAKRAHISAAKEGASFKPIAAATAAEAVQSLRVAATGGIAAAADTPATDTAADFTTVEATASKWQDPALAEQLQTALRGAAAAEAERDDLLGERADLHKQLAVGQAALKATREKVGQLEQAVAAAGKSATRQRAACNRPKRNAISRPVVPRPPSRKAPTLRGNRPATRQKSSGCATRWPRSARPAKPPRPSWRRRSKSKLR